MSKQYEKEFKENAVRYRNDHPDLTVKDCAKNLGICTLYNTNYFDGVRACKWLCTAI